MAVGETAARTGRGWAIRVSVALVLILLCGLSLSYSFAQVLVRSAPAAAHRLAPYDGRITAAMASVAVALDPRAAIDEENVLLARRALRQEPTAVSAVTTLGLYAEAKQDKPAARGWFNYANRLTRRNSQTQLWAIEDAVGRNDIAAALREYDIALRTSPKLSDLLFPVLGQATTDPDIRRYLADTLAARPVWGDGFVTYLAARQDDARPAALLFANLHARRIDVPDAARIGIINALLGQQRSDEAWTYYAVTTPDADRRQSRDPNFRASRTASPFDWVTVNDQGIDSSIQHGAEGGTFDFVVPFGIGGAVLRQLQVLPSGRYRLEASGSVTEPSVRTPPYWVLRCEDRRELGRVRIDGPGQPTGRYTGTFDVPGNCPVQYLEFVVSPSENSQGATGQFSQVLLSPVTVQP